MRQISLQDLRRVAESLASLHGRSVADATMRSDGGQLRVEFSDGLMMVVSAVLDETGRPRMEVDVVRRPSESGSQLEVRFESA